MHTSGGYLTQAAFSNKVVHDLHPESDVVLVHRRHRLGDRPSLCKSDARQRRTAGARTRGTPDTPHPGSLVGDRAEVRRHILLYSAPPPSARSMKLGRAIPKKFDLSSLRVLGSCG
jgi:acetyl-CoA synthetase